MPKKMAKRPIPKKSNAPRHITSHGMQKAVSNGVNSRHATAKELEHDGRQANKQSSGQRGSYRKVCSVDRHFLPSLPLLCGPQ